MWIFVCYFPILLVLKFEDGEFPMALLMHVGSWRQIGGVRVQTVLRRMSGPEQKSELGFKRNSHGPLIY